jgi:hypothetical protein
VVYYNFFFFFFWFVFLFLCAEFNFTFLQSCWACKENTSTRWRGDLRYDFVCFFWRDSVSLWSSPLIPGLKWSSSIGLPSTPLLLACTTPPVCISLLFTQEFLGHLTAAFWASLFRCVSWCLPSPLHLDLVQPPHLLCSSGKDENILVLCGETQLCP